MAESSWPTTAGSRVVTDDQYEHLAWGWARADGILGNPGDTSVCFGDSSGRQVKMRSGKRGFVRGRGWYSGTSDNILAIAANASGSTRKDVIVLRLTRSTWAVTAAVVQGTPGAGNPSLTQNATGGTTGVWEIPVAVVTVVNGAATIAAADVEQCVWYSHGDKIVTLSTAPIQPDAAQYTNMLHSDTGFQWETVSGAWRRGPWQAAWGVIGGTRYTAGTALAVGVGTSEVTFGMSTGAVTLKANRRYRFRLFVKVSQGTAPASAVIVIRIRETNVAGTERALAQLPLTSTSATYNHQIVGEYVVGGADEVKTLVATGLVSAGLWNAYTGTASELVGIFVEDVGPASPNPVTTV